MFEILFLIFSMGEGAKIYMINCKRGTQRHCNFEGAKIYVVNENGAPSIMVKCKRGTQHHESEEKK